MNILTKTAISATLHCLTGCAIGEVLGMVIGTALNWHSIAVTILSIILAFIFGYALTAWSAFRHGMGFRRALLLAAAADTASIASMEAIDNAFIWLIPGAIAVPLDDWLFWGTLLASLVIAFAVTVPLNRLLIAKGKGHAVIHDLLHH